MKSKLLLCLFLIAFMAVSAGAVTINVPADYITIQAAITAASIGDTVIVANGTYNETLTITQSIHITGESEAGVIIDIPTAGGYGITVNASDVFLENFTMLANTTNQNYPIHASGTGNPPSGYDNLTIQNVTIQGTHRRTGFDIHGYNNVVLSHLTSTDATGGNGLQVTGCIGVTMDNITTSNNAWGSIAIYCSSASYLNRGSDDVVIDGNTLSLAEGTLMKQDEFGLTSTNITVSGYEYIVRNLAFRPDAAGFYFYQDTQADAIAYALGLDAVAVGSFILPIGGGDYFVGPGMSIQAAIDAASAGETVTVWAGTYREQLYIDKGIDLTGAGSGVCIVEAPDAVDRTTYSITQWTGSVKTIDAVIGVNAAGTVNIDGFTIDGRDTGPINFYGVHYFNTSGAFTNCVIDNVTYPGGPGAQSVVSFVGTHSLGETFSIDISNNTIPTFQKGGFVLMGPGCTFTVNDNTVSGVSTSTIAGNCIQLSYGASGSTSGNYVEGTAYTGEDWSSTGILLFESGDVTMDGDEVYNCQSGVNFSDWGWGYVNPSVVTLGFSNLNLHDNEFTLGVQLSRDNSDINMTVTDCELLNNGGDGIDFYATGSSSYYTGWSNGDLNATITGCLITNSGMDGIWGGDYSGNVNNVNIEVHGCAFIGNVGTGINNGFTQTIDATECYWGAAAPPPASSRSLASSQTIRRPSPFGKDIEEIDSKASTVSRLASSIGQTIIGPVNYTPYWDENYIGDPHTTPWTWGVDPSGTIQAAIDAASAGDLISLDAGTFVEPAQVVINKDLTIRGAGKALTIVEPGFNTSIGYYLISDAMIFVDYGVDASIEDLSIDGTGFTVRHAIQSRGTNLDVKNCDIRDIYASIYAGRGIVFLTGTGLVENCTMSNIQRIGIHIRGGVETPAPNVDVVDFTYVGKGVGDFLDYGIEFGGGGIGTALNCNITACRGVASVDGSGSAGILATDYYGTGTAATITDCSITDNSIGIYAGYAAGDATVVVAYHNDIYGNDLGIFSVTDTPVNAEENWWGSASGAVVAAMNDGSIDFTPWCSDATHTNCTLTSGLSLTPDAALIKCGDQDTVWIAIDAGVTGVEAASFSIGYDENFMTAVEVIEGPDFADMSLYTDFATLGSVQIDIGVLAGDFSGPGTIVGVVFAPTNDAASTAITFDVSILRDAGNQDIYHTTANAVREIDCTLPIAPTDFAVLPGHEKVKLSWVNPIGDPSFVGVEVRRNPWAIGAYPEYDDFAAALGYPATQLEGDLVYQGTAESYVDTNNTTNMPRNAYYYTVLAYDNAGNYSVVTALQNGRAINYWLGDVTGDGNVYYEDLLPFSNTYYESEGSGVYNNEFDIGPTYDLSPSGIPTTDNIVNFEDLSIFSINFNVVGPNLKAVPMFDDTEITGPIALALVAPAVSVMTGDIFTVNVALQNNDGTIKAAWYSISFDPADLELIDQSSSSVISKTEQPLFYDGRVKDGNIDISLAILGGEMTLIGSGDLTQLRFRMLGDGSSLKFDQVEFRDVKNQSIEVVKNGLIFSSLSAMPDDFSLGQNYPNPFNPATSINFSLPSASYVTLEIFNIVGQQVAVLVDGNVEAGEHTVTWNGQRQASGVYLYKLTTNGFVETKKMLLLK